MRSEDRLWTRGCTVAEGPLRQHGSMPAALSSSGSASPFSFQKFTCFCAREAPSRQVHSYEPRNGLLGDQEDKTSFEKEGGSIENYFSFKKADQFYNCFCNSQLQELLAVTWVQVLIFCLDSSICQLEVKIMTCCETYMSY